MRELINTPLPFGAEKKTKSAAHGINTFRLVWL